MLFESVKLSGVVFFSFRSMPYVNLPASNQNITLYYDLHGSGEIKVLFIMGLRTEGRIWKYQVNTME